MGEKMMSGEYEKCGEHTLDCSCREINSMEWISFEDRLPECENVLAIYVSDKNVSYNMRHDGWFRDTIYSCRFENGKFIIQSHGPIMPITHWMPLPEPPNN